MRVRGISRWYLAAIWLAVATVLVPASFIARSSAQADEGFSLQVSPSPLVTTVSPGSDTTLELQIRNTNSSEQKLKMGLRSFSIDEVSGEVKLGQSAPNEVQNLVRFESPTFALAPGEIYTQRIRVTPSASAGFSYNFAITIALQEPPKAEKGKTTIAGSVAVFTLINVDKPGASRKFELKGVSVSKHSYEYLPAEISVKLKNTGNVNVQPAGTIFIQRHSSDTKPMATLPLNDTGGFVLPGTSRTFTASWSDGFPHYEEVKDGDKVHKKLVWKGGLSDLRIGKYVAKVVAVYDDGQRDVPIMTEVSFWVIPWRMLLILFIVILILVVGTVVLVRSASRAVGATSRKIRHAKHADTEK